MERLQKVIANSGYCSRRKAEDYIKLGKVYVNGEKVTELGTKVSYNDAIEVNGEMIKVSEDKVYYILNKPRGVISSVSDDKGRKTVVDFISTDKRIYPIGRLDYDTTGVLLLTNDGELTNALLHPSNNIEKVYIAKIKGLITEGHRKTLETGVVIDGKKTGRCKTRLIKLDKKTNTSVVALSIHEGRNHQVKNMFKELGYQVIKLRRDSVAFLNCDGLKPGEYRYLSIKEVKVLYNLINNK